LERKDARTAPLLPDCHQYAYSLSISVLCKNTVCPSDLAPDAPDLAASDLLLRSVNVHDLLSEVEAERCVSLLLLLLLSSGM
jgi:hypothetical protein